MELELSSDLIYKNGLDTDRFARMLNDPSQCYKFYWMDAILDFIAKGVDEISFDDLIDGMICGAWHSVTRYHLRLGPTVRGSEENHLEAIIHILQQDKELSETPGKEAILAAIRRNKEKIQKSKTGLTQNVPYRLLSSFIDGVGGSDKIWRSQKRMIAQIAEENQQRRFFYTIIDGTATQKKIVVDSSWMQLVKDNLPVIRSWVALKKVRFLQDRNPGVPGIIYKLDAESERTRHLEQARKLWILCAGENGGALPDIYSDAVLDPAAFDLDHFVPWSFVASDELWNLTPMDKGLNASKNNRLPAWEPYFDRFAKAQFWLCSHIFASPKLRKQFEACRRDNLNAIWAAKDLFIESNSEEEFYRILKHNLRPVYEAARLQGYTVWDAPQGAAAPRAREASLWQ